MAVKKAAPPTTRTALVIALEWRAKRAERLEKKKEMETLEVYEKSLKQELIDRLKTLANKAVSNGDRLIQLVTENKPQVKPEDWPKLYAHIKKTGEFELLERRLGRTAAQERIDQGIKIPGVSVFPVETISDTKAK